MYSLQSLVKKMIITKKEGDRMENFTFWNPTRLIFGKGELSKLSEEISPFGRKVLVVYGGGSIKRNGLYDKVMNELEKMDAEVYELGGVDPNPRVSSVREGVNICREKEIDFILAVGGGSVIDCTKAIAGATKFAGDAWDMVTNKVRMEEAIPFGTVLTLAATGSEMNSGAVITNWETHEKLSWGSPAVFPQFSILDPEHTYSVPRDQTIYGIVDMMSHVLEHYFHLEENTDFQDRMCESLLTTIMDTAPKLIDDLENYEHRATILYSGTMALNGILNMGYKGDWATHNIEHAVSAVYDIPHGGGLAILFPHWIKHTLHAKPERMKQLAIRVFEVDPTGKTDEEVALEGIARLRLFWNSIDAPEQLSDYGIDDSKLEDMANKAVHNGPFGRFQVLDKEDVLSIYRSAL